MMSKLKACPFCGGSAELGFNGKFNGDYCKGFIIVKCRSCGASAKGAFYEGEPLPIDFDFEDTIGGETAIYNWNRRI